MPIQLSIRNNLRSAADQFGASRVCTFGDHDVTVGSAATCDCRIEDPAVAPHHLTFSPPEESTGNWTVHPRPDCVLYRDAEVLSAGDSVRSGDELRIEHWLIRFRKVHAAAVQGRRASVTATVAKLLVIIILGAELGLVVWLPRRLHEAALWEKDIARQRTTMMLDQLRSELRAFLPATNDTFRQSAGQLLQDELDRVARFLREHGDDLPREQWRQIRSDLDAYERVFRRMRENRLVQAPPDFDLQAGIQQVLDRERGAETEREHP